MELIIGLLINIFFIYLIVKVVKYFSRNKKSKEIIHHKPDKRQIEVFPFVQNVVGISLKEIRKDEKGYAYVYIYVSNLSSDILPFNLYNAFLVTKDGVQIEGNVSTLAIDGVKNNSIMPHLKVERSIFFYNRVQRISKGDILIVRIQVHGTIHMLSMYLK